MFGFIWNWFGPFEVGMKFGGMLAADAGRLPPYGVWYEATFMIDPSVNQFFTPTDEESFGRVRDDDVPSRPRLLRVDA